MGEISIDIRGSFAEILDVKFERSFTARRHSHAFAVAEVIQYLSDEVLPAAIELDHKLHDENERPPGGLFRNGSDSTQLPWKGEE